MQAGAWKQLVSQECIQASAANEDSQGMVVAVLLGSTALPLPGDFLEPAETEFV